MTKHSIETHNRPGGGYKFLKAGRTHGEKYLLKLGYKYKNSIFLEKDGERFHYNRLLKGWITL